MPRPVSTPTPTPTAWPTPTPPVSGHSVDSAHHSPPVHLPRPVRRRPPLTAAATADVPGASMRSQQGTLADDQHRPLDPTTNLRKPNRDQSGNPHPSNTPMAPAAGLEPATYRLTAGRSAN